MKVKEDGEKPGLKLNIQKKTRIIASGPITSWQIDRETIETVRDFLFLGCKITADGDYSHEIKRHLLLERKAMTNLDSILKAEASFCHQRSIQSKLWFFQQSRTDVESWITIMAECWRIDTFELWCRRRLFTIPCIASRSKQSILKEINPEYSLEGLMLKLQYFG